MARWVIHRSAWHTAEPPAAGTMVTHVCCRSDRVRKSGCEGFQELPCRPRLSRVCTRRKGKLSVSVALTKTYFLMPIH